MQLIQTSRILKWIAACYFWAAIFTYNSFGASQIVLLASASFPQHNDQKIHDAAQISHHIRHLNKKVTSLSHTCGHKSSNHQVSRLVGFYRDGKISSSGRTLEALLEEDDDELEEAHNYIQWLFPTNELSEANLSAPVLLSADIVEFKNNKKIQENLKKSLNRMLDFYGFEKNQSSDSDEPSFAINQKTFQKKSKKWLKPRNHNFLRITRILTSLKLLGLKAEAKGLFDLLEKEIYSNPEYKKAIGEESFNYWKKAIEEDSPLHGPEGLVEKK